MVMESLIRTFEQVEIIIHNRFDGFIAGIRKCGQISQFVLKMKMF